MTPRQKALAASSPALIVLLGSLAWAIWDARDDLLGMLFPPSQ